MSKRAKRIPEQHAPRWQVMAMLGDYHLAHQPFWDREFEFLETAYLAADALWHWCLGTYGTSWAAQYDGLGPFANGDYFCSPEVSNAPPDTDSMVQLCVFLYDHANDEMCERPLYVRGNPRASEEA